MDLASLVGRSPQRLRVAADRVEVSYELVEDLVAAHGRGPSPEAVMILEGDRISVEPLASVASRRPVEGRVGPVYRRLPGGDLAVPTGRVFARFGEGDSAARHQDELAAAGYRLDEVPSYAPHAAWLRAASGTIGDALRRLEQVRRLPAVEHAEPQLLTAAARR